MNEIKEKERIKRERKKHGKKGRTKEIKKRKKE